MWPGAAALPSVSVTRWPVALPDPEATDAATAVALQQTEQATAATAAARRAHLAPRDWLRRRVRAESSIGDAMSSDALSDGFQLRLGARHRAQRWSPPRPWP